MDQPIFHSKNSGISKLDARWSTDYVVDRFVNKRNIEKIDFPALVQWNAFYSPAAAAGQRDALKSGPQVL